MNYAKCFMILLAMAVIAPGCSRNDKKSQTASEVKVRAELVSLIPEKPQYYIGTIEAYTSVPISFLTSGMVEKVNVVEGQHVKKGDLLAMLDSRSYQNALDMAVAKEKQAEDAYRRLSDLYKKGSLPEVKFVDAETGLTQMKAATEITRKNLADCILYAPSSGVIGSRTIEPGSNVVPYTTVLTLIDISRIYVRIPVPEKEVASIKAGQTAIVRVPALGDEAFQGRIEEKGVIANPITHTYEVKIMLSNSGEKLMPGMVCKVWTDNGEAPLQVVVPLYAIQTDGNGQSYVYTVDTLTNKAVRKQITTGSISGNGVIVTSGLIPGDKIIVAGFQQISENSTLQIEK